MSDAAKHEYFMKKALGLAAKGAGEVNPNPMVGAVLVKDGLLVASGYHRRRGGLHAEREALRDVGPGQASDSTLYVTLEPCCHDGLTPPCTEAIIAHGISRVVVGALDPNPLVSGKGVAQLRERGVVVEQGVLQEECEQINKVFNHFITHRTPYVIMKYAMTADGKIATRTGSSQWITGEGARKRTHELRGLLSGIMVGVGTVLADDPLLTCRSGEGRNPVRVICDSDLRIPEASRVVQTADTYPTLVTTVSGDSSRRRMLQNYGVDVLTTKAREGRVDLRDLVRQLGEREIDGVLLEGGARLNYSALEAGIVHELLVYIGAKLFGSGMEPVAGTGVAKVGQAFPLSLKRADVVGNDVVLDYKVGKDSCSQEL